MSYFMLYFDKLMKNLGVTNNNFLSKKFGQVQGAMEVGVSPMTVTSQLSSTARFRTFSPQILLKHIFFMLYFDHLMQF